MNLTDQQKDLPRLLVSKHESSARAQSIFVRGANAASLCYPGGDSVGVPYDDNDLRRLRLERLVALIPVDENHLRGKPTQFGIEMVRRGFFVKRVMKEYETRCPLLAAGAMERLNEWVGQREVGVSQQIELATASIRARREEIRQITDDRNREVAEAVLLLEAATLRRGIIEVAETLATEGVRAFANCLLTSQGRLGGHAVLLREYTARFASGIRHWLNASEAFRMEPVSPWRQDPITQQAIRTCEDVLAESERIEGGLPSTNEEAERDVARRNENEPRTWPPIVQEWEALKSARRLITEEHERIPDADLRSILAGQYMVKPEDLTDGQIEYAALELCRHYGRVQIIPSDARGYVSRADESQEPNPIRDAAFWKEREAAFHQRDKGENAILGVTWFSHGAHWEFHAGSRTASLAEAVRVFKPLAMEAAKGLCSKPGSKSWMDWLDLLRRAKDEDTGEFLYAKYYPGSFVRSEREMERLIEAGEAIPAGGVIEFVGNSDGGIERRTYWDTSTVTIENLFKNSANYCSKLRSLAPLPMPSVGEKTGSEAVSGVPSKEIAMDESGRPAEGPLEGAASELSATAAIGEPEAEFQARSWNEVEISFFNEFSVEIRVGPTKAIDEFGRLRMANKRSGNPSLAWQTLHYLAISNGVISAPVGEKPNWGKVEKRMQEIRAWLRSLFGLRSDPLPFVKGVGYRAAFAIKCAPSYKR